MFVPGCFPACDSVFILVAEPVAGPPQEEVVKAKEVVEATITPQAGTTTGDDIANPYHSEKLDELAKQETEKQVTEKQEETQETSS